MNGWKSRGMSNEFISYGGPEKEQGYNASMKAKKNIFRIYMKEKCFSQLKRLPSFNPSNAEATFIQSPLKSLKTI